MNKQQATAYLVATGARVIDREMTQADKEQENARIYHAITGKTWDGAYYGVYARWSIDGTERSTR